MNGTAAVVRQAVVNERIRALNQRRLVILELRDGLDDSRRGGVRHAGYDSLLADIDAKLESLHFELADILTLERG